MLRTRFPILLPAVLVASCSGLSTNIDYQEGFDFGAWRTFAWNAAGDPALDGLTERRIIAAVGTELQERGYTEQAEGADFLVAIHAGTEDKVDVTNWGYGYRRGRWYGTASDVSVRHYTEGTLIVDLVDGDSKELIWRGTARATVDPDLTPEQRTQRIRDAVGKLLAGFPPSGP